MALPAADHAPSGSLDVRGPNQLGILTAHFLCGAYVPIVFFPAWLETLCRVLPFAWMVQVPIEMWLGEHRGIDLLVVYAAQAAWLLGLVVIGRLVLARAVRGWWCRVAERRRCSSGCGGGWSARRSAPAGSTAPRSCCSC